MAFWRDGKCIECDPLCQSCYAEGEQCLICADGTKASNGKCNKTITVDNKDSFFSIFTLDYRFHTYLLLFIAFLAFISLTMRISMKVYSIYYDCQYKSRRHNQIMHWKKMKKSLESMTEKEKINYLKGNAQKKQGYSHNSSLKSLKSSNLTKSKTIKATNFGSPSIPKIA